MDDLHRPAEWVGDWEVIAWRYRIACSGHDGAHYHPAPTPEAARAKASALDAQYGPGGRYYQEGNPWTLCVPWIPQKQPIGEWEALRRERTTD